MKLLFDMDSVLADLTTKWYTRYNEDYNDNITAAKVTSWGVEHFVKPECGDKMQDYLDEPGFFADLKPIEGAIEGVRQLSEAGHEIYIVSASRPAAYTDKYNWLMKHMPFLDYHKIIFTHSKGIIDGDALIDDGVHNLEAFYNHHKGSRLCVVVDAPHNKEIKFPVLRVASVAEFARIMHKRHLVDIILQKANHM